MAFCSACDKKVDDYAKRCPYCNCDFSYVEEVLYKNDTSVVKPRLVLTAALFLLWIFHLCYSAHYWQNLAQLLLSLFFTPISIICYIVTAPHVPSTLLESIYGNFLSLILVIIISLMGCYLYSKLLIPSRKLTESARPHLQYAVWPIGRLKQLGVFVIILFLASFIRFPERKYDPLSHRISCASNLKQINLALQQYAMDYNGYFPPYNDAKGLNILITNEYLTDKNLFRCPTIGANYYIWDKRKSMELPLTDKNLDYHYIGGYKETDPPTTVICRDKDDSHKAYGNVLYLDGTVKNLKNEKWRELLKNKPDNLQQAE